MAATRLPDRPLPEHYRRQAKDLHKALASADPAAVERLRQFHPRAIAAGDAKLADAQLVLAREHGFASWPAFRAMLGAATIEPAEPASFSAQVRCDAGPLGVDVMCPPEARGLVLFVLAGNVGRGHRGIAQIASHFHRAGFAAVLADLLTDAETIEDAIDEELRYDLPRLEARVATLLDWIGEQARLAALPLALYGGGTGGAVAVRVAAEFPASVSAVVCCAGRPDLAGSAAWRVRAPSLFVFGGDDAVGHGFGRLVAELFPRDVPAELSLIDGIGLRFEEGPAAALAAQHAIGWLERHLVRAPQMQETGQ